MGAVFRIKGNAAMTIRLPFGNILPEHELPHEETTGTRRVYDARYLHVRVDDVVLPSGRDGERYIVERGQSVVIIPVTDDDHVLLVRQYRYAAGKHLIELPAGMVDPGEGVLETAGRELIEETGHKAATLRVIAATYMSPGYTDEHTTFVLAEGCSPIAFETDPDEPMHVERVPVSAIPELLVADPPVFEQAQAMLGLLWLLRLRR